MYLTIFLYFFNIPMYFFLFFMKIFFPRFFVRYMRVFRKIQVAWHLALCSINLKKKFLKKFVSINRDLSRIGFYLIFFDFFFKDYLGLNSCLSCAFFKISKFGFIFQDFETNEFYQNSHVQSIGESNSYGNLQY